MIDFEDLMGSTAKELPRTAEKECSSKSGDGPPISNSPQSDSQVTDEDWFNDSISVKMEKIREAFLNGKSAKEVRAAASMMMVGDWLELVSKLAPKRLDIKGDFSFKHLVDQFGPIDTEKYRLKAVDAEYRVVETKLLDGD